MLEAYRQHVEERASQGVVPKPLDAAQLNDLVDLLKNPPAGEEELLVDLIENRVPAGVDDAAYVKAAFLAAVAKGETSSPLIDKVRATELLGTMLGGYNIEPLIDLLDDEEVASTAVAGLSKTLLMFDAFHDVVEKSKSPWHIRGQYGWVLRHRRALPEPLPCKGTLKLWRLPRNVKIRRAIEKAIRGR